MPRLRLPGRRPRGDRGAVAALVAVLLTGNALLGMAALTVDVGAMYAEREELQSGADSAAVAVAKVCVGNNNACNPIQAAAIAGTYAVDNASDGFADATVCGRVMTAGLGSTNRLSPCAPGKDNLARCIDGPTSPPVSPAPYVEVRTTTRRSATSTALPPVFVGAVTGTDGVTVAACSRVSWGPITQTTIEPSMAISKCQFDAMTANGTRYQPRPTSVHNADPTSEFTMRWRPVSGSGCATFGFFNTRTASSCRRSVTAGNSYGGRTDPAIPTNCAVDLENFHHDRRPVAVAIFDSASSTQFHVAGIAMFVITGWYRSPLWPDGGLGHDHLPELGNATPCTGLNIFCVYGYFTTQLFRTGTGTGNVAGTLGSNHFGTAYVRTIG